MKVTPKFREVTLHVKLPYYSIHLWPGETCTFTSTQMQNGFIWMFFIWRFFTPLLHWSMSILILVSIPFQKHYCSHPPFCFAFIISFCFLPHWWPLEPYYSLRGHLRVAPTARGMATIRHLQESVPETWALAVAAKPSRLFQRGWQGICRFTIRCMCIYIIHIYIYVSLSSCKCVIYT